MSTLIDDHLSVGASECAQVEPRGLITRVGRHRTAQNSRASVVLSVSELFPLFELV